MLFALFTFVAAPVAAAPQTVSFPDGRDGLTLNAELYKPAGEGPHPAVVVLHGCTGVEPVHRAWAEKLQTWGFAALVIDSLTPREQTETCRNPFNVSAAARQLDAFGGYLWLAEQDWVDSNNIGVVGWSHGGWTALKSVSRNGMWRYTERMDGKTFKAAANFYPSCKTAAFFITPVLILIGEADTLTTAKDCLDLIETRHENSTIPEVHTYPDVFHAYDMPEVSGELMGHTLAYNEAATKDSEQRLKTFLDQNLKPASDK